ncbi:phospholipid phosphatase-related protein type 2 isoform X2 [Antechinus flavipes]|uniref:phospholipid phosphatase-related protein type 2 isoform X2 n=1 Tax=Antechinus flavipes TaxID=38775 RepID=UPI0022366B06|nr:phospholipid phosphatase-related protein type 2 isoform X2 [Antechinus flavipes]
MPRPGAGPVLMSRRTAGALPPLPPSSLHPPCRSPAPLPSFGRPSRGACRARARLPSASACALLGPPHRDIRDQGRRLGPGLAFPAVGRGSGPWSGRDPGPRQLSPSSRSGHGEWAARPEEELLHNTLLHLRGGLLLLRQRLRQALPGPGGRQPRPAGSHLPAGHRGARHHDPARRAGQGLLPGSGLRRAGPEREDHCVWGLLPLQPSPPKAGVYSFGLFTTSIFANAGQVVTGNPTPHFLSVCHPNYTALGCPPPATDKPGLDRYVTDQGACAAGNPALVAAARRAFPCKDAALCAFAVTYTAMYVTLVFRVKGSRLVKPSLCLALLCPAFLVGVVRVAEYRNHWSDVLAGFLTGAAIATFLVTCVVNKFQSRVPLSQRTFRWEGLATVPAIENPLEKLNSAQEPKTTAPPLQPARLTPPKLQSCTRRGHLIPSCVSSRAPPMCSSPRVPRARVRSEPTLPAMAPGPSQGPPPSPGPSGAGGGGGGGGRGRKLLLPTPLLRDLYTLSGLYPSPFHRDSFSPYLFASRDHLL